MGSLATNAVEDQLSAFASEEAFLRRCAADFEFFCVHALKIRVMGPGRRYIYPPLVLTPEQRAVARWVMLCINWGVDVRVIIDKCRKLGMSTLVEALGYWMCCFRQGFRALVIAHKKQATDQIALINKGYNRRLPEPLKPIIGAKEAYNSLLWPDDWGSKFECMTQGGTDQTRGGDRSFMHLSELAFWDSDRRTTGAEDVLTAIVGDEPWILIVESTANGMAGAFYDYFTTKWSDWHNPIIDRKEWKPFFFSWVGVPKYAQQVRKNIWSKHWRMVYAHERGQADLAARYAQDLKYGKEWFERTIEYGLTPEQVAWALAKLRDFNGDLRKFDQEFPITWQMSFISSGRPVFDQAIVQKWMQRGIPEGTVMFDRMLDEPMKGTGAGDAWHIYEPIDPMEEYIIGIDAASGGGTKDDDNGVIKVFARRSQRFVAELYDNSIDPTQLARQAVIAAKWFNNAFIIPEIDNHGYALVKEILELGYRNMQRRKPGKQVRAGTSWAQKWGWKSTPENRTRTIQDMRRKFLHETYHDYSPRTKAEYHTFVFDKRGKPDHMPGKRDDGITASRLCLDADSRLRAPKELTGPEGPAEDTISRVMSNWNKLATDKTSKAPGYR